jgi:hypothetical protein
MKLNRVDFDDTPLPTTIHVTMTVDEAAAIARWGGSHQPNTVPADLYRELVSSVFNRYWHDGLDGYERGETE